LEKYFEQIGYKNTPDVVPEIKEDIKSSTVKNSKVTDKDLISADSDSDDLNGFDHDDGIYEQDIKSSDNEYDHLSDSSDNSEPIIKTNKKQDKKQDKDVDKKQIKSMTKSNTKSMSKSMSKIDNELKIFAKEIGVASSGVNNDSDDSDDSDKKPMKQKAKSKDAKEYVKEDVKENKKPRVNDSMKMAELREIAKELDIGLVYRKDKKSTPKTKAMLIDDINKK
jgi:hypothetical protein